ncbi:CASP C terminal-domain-containing protein [Limtongia smithiae]|uniref:CASP C terminal-domain-containing protein n=1 Tax=Limtongia smithiae TaxID=1125753 RepID=UPI0034CE72EC
MNAASTEQSLEERLTPFEQALKAWGDINLTELQKQLDNQGLEIVENQKHSVIGRKELAAKTKEFRKLPDENKLVEIKVLLKAYQGEIDSLTRRGKAAENAFLGVYRVLGEAPDPYPLLEATLDSLLASDEVNKLNNEVVKLKSQLSMYSDYDTLRAKIVETEQKASERVVQKVAAKQAELQALLDEKDRNWKLREEALNRQVQEAREQIHELRATHAIAELRLEQHEQKLDEGVSSRFAESEMLAADLERVNLRALQTERRNLELRQELQKMKSSVGTELVPEEELVEWKRKVDILQSENNALARKIDATREDAKAHQDKDLKTVKSLERENARKSQEVEGLKAKLSHMGDYEDIKRELDILKSVEFSTEADEDTDDVRVSPRLDVKSETLEQLLLARNKKLSAELTTLRGAHEKVRTKLAELEKSMTSTTAQLDQSTKLNRKLEDDLMSLHESTPGAMSVASYAASKRSGGRAADTVSLISGSLRAGLPRFDGDAMSQVGSGAVTPVGASGSLRTLDQHMADLTILPIITQQRDRFRARNAELEQELRKEYGLITDLRSQIETLQKDNVALYEKTRYLATYRTQTSAAEIRAGREDESGPYRNEYEAQISPFAQFRGREQERAMSRMGPLERVIYGLTRVALANKTSRNLFFGYIMGLHLFLMGTIWYLALGEVGRHDSIATAAGGLATIARAGEQEQAQRDAGPGDVS